MVWRCKCTWKVYAYIIEKPISKDTEKPISKNTKKSISKDTEKLISKDIEKPISNQTEKSIENTLKRLDFLVSLGLGTQLIWYFLLFLSI